MLFRFIFYILLVFVNSSCTTGIACEDKDKKISFKHRPEFQSVNIAGFPTHKANSSWVKKIFVSDEAFLLLTAQNTVKMEKTQNCDKQTQNCLKRNVVPVYKLETYKEKEGYKYWSNLTEKEKLSITDINSRLSRQPEFHAPKCYTSSGTDLRDLVLIMKRI